MIDDDFIEAMQEEYLIKRFKAMREAREREDKIYREIPEIRTIDDKLKRNAQRFIARAVSQCGADKRNSATKHELQELANANKQEGEELMHRRKVLLQEHGYSEDYTDIQYECKKCSDYGYLNGRTCECASVKA